MRFRCLSTLFACGILASAVSAGAQEPPSARFSMPAVRAATPPRIDGVLEDAEWKDAARGEDFIQFQPNRGEPSELRTVVFVQYDDTHLYVAFDAHDPQEPLAQMTQRDAQLWNDDSVQIFLDTFHDRRTGYFFFTNILGTQLDGRIGDDGTNNDDSWDATWTAAARRVPHGYTVEVSIPFESLKYVAGENVTWGVNFARSRRRTLERSFWAGPVDNWGRMSQAGTLVGLNVSPPARRHLVVPYTIGQLQDGRSPDGDVGLDVRYALTPQTAVYGTLNPDFATVEADQEVINLTRFEVSLTEKRQFFLEGQEQFNQRIRTFYSRRISDIIGGAKLLGKQGPWSFAAISARSDFPSAPGAATYTVARLQRDLAGRSTVAVMAADRTIGGRHQGSIEMDTSLFFTQTFGMTGQFVKSYGEFGRGSTAFFVRPSYDSSTAHAHVRYTHMGDRVADNVNAVGFILDDDRRELDSALDKTVWLGSGPAERLSYSSNYNVYWGQTGTLRSWQVDEYVFVDWRSKWSTEVSHREEFKRFEKDFRNRVTTLDLGYDTRSWQSVRGGVAFGHNFDSDFTLWSASGRYKVTDELSAEYELQRLDLDPDPLDASTWIHVLRASQTFTPDLLLRVFFQTNSAIDRRNVQAVFVYRYLPPFGTVQVAYQRGTAEFGQRSQQGNTLFVKLTAVL